MTERISLVEQYNNKDIIVQVKKCLDQTAEAVTVSTEARGVAAASASEAHTASQNANAASTQAQTAAQTVATYGTRLQNVEDQAAGNRSSIQTIDGEITDIYNDLTNVVRKIGDAGQVVMNGLDLRGTNSVPNTVIGQSDARPANGKRVIDELNAYQPMLRTTGNQTLTGKKTNTSNQCFEAANINPSDGFICKSLSDDANTAPTATINYPLISWFDKNDVKTALLRLEHTTDATIRLVLYLRQTSGNYKSVLLGSNA